MEPLTVKLETIYSQAIEKSFPQLAGTRATIRPSIHADYQCNSAMALIKKVKELNIEGKLDPKSLAEKLAANVPDNDLIATQTVDKGFINISLQDGYVGKKVLSILKDGIVIVPEKKQKVIIDYSAPNIAKEMHVGHLRSTIIGDSIANILEFLGHEVHRINHIGDWGTAFGMLLAYMEEKFPDYVESPPAIGDLQKFYQEAKKRFDEDPDFNKKSKDCVVKLQSKEPAIYRAWELICEISRKEFQQIYDVLDIHGLIERGESFYQDKMSDMVEDLKKRELIVQDDGRWMFFINGKTKEVPLTVIKSDGGFTYDTSDVACLRYRVATEKADRIIYVTDAGQESHFRSIFAAAQQAGYYDPEKVLVQHVVFGLVLGEKGTKFKTRSGDSVRLKELLDEGIVRAEQKLKEKERDKILSPEELEVAKKAIAYGCIKYSDLAQDRIKNYEFSFDRMLDDRGNTAVYLLYCLARIRSIIRKTGITKSAKELADETKELVLTHPRELRLAKFILKFPDIIMTVSETLSPHTLCTFLFELSVVFSEFYEQCYVIEKIPGGDSEQFKVNMERVLLCEATSYILSLGLKLLGIKLVEKL
ncbi:arginine--tRNA ligase, cytoplasmic-like [Panonychus citri]|uniref:arginine--tRNA ligase, cytoplasmic-like n=1 Tax=Panonychus citri TaxID=50023 RepID=UPI002307B9D9|nr:arginine--tRNA ligase, cytoplasmic-like [Panonychus citri]XP_053208784.1 arginine--tRNA ligase, cytoplasmic-like [Panonychus citri]